MKGDYSAIDQDHGTTPYVLPPFPCGWYLHISQFGEQTVYQFRRMPRAGKYTGRYGLWLKDKDAGMVLIGVVPSDWKQTSGHPQAVIVAEGTTYKAQYLNFVNGLSPLDGMPGKSLGLFKRACAWCGRELTDPTRLCHGTKKCTPSS